MSVLISSQQQACVHGVSCTPPPVCAADAGDSNAAAVIVTRRATLFKLQSSRDYQDFVGLRQQCGFGFRT
jgi:hypothetical protein